MFGENLKKLRKNHNLTQSQLGAMVGVTGAYIQQLENNIKTNPSIDLIGRLCNRLGTTINELIENDENMRSLIINQGALSASYLFPYTGHEEENDWIMQNLNPKQKEEYIRNSEIYLKNKEKINIKERQIDLLAAYVETIAMNFIEIDKDKIDEFSIQIASWLKEYIETLTKAKIKEIIEKNIPFAEK